MRSPLPSLIVAVLLMGLLLTLNVTENYRYGKFAPPGPTYFVVTDFVSSYGWPLTFYSHTHHEMYKDQASWNLIALFINMFTVLVTGIAGAVVFEFTLRVREEKERERQIQRELDATKVRPTRNDE